MINRQEVFNLIRDRIWIYQSVMNSDPNPILLTLTGSDEETTKSFFSLYFHEDGRVSAATKVGFFPNEFANWDFDEATQEIIFINRDDQSELRASLPQELSYGGLDAIKLKNEQADADRTIQFVNNPEFDRFEITKSSLSGKKVFIAPRANYEPYFRFSMRWNGFNIKLTTHSAPSVEFFSDAYDHLVAHPHVEEIILSQKNKDIIEFPRDQKLLFLNNQGTPSFEYLSGNRSAIMELLIVILSENNLRLFDDGDKRDETTMLQDILTSHFQGRYELKDLPEF